MINHNNLFYVSFEKEITDSKRLIEEIKKLNWIDSNVVIVNCFPDYSSIPCQLINHKLSYLNNDVLFEQIILEMPYNGMKQIWEREKYRFEMFDRYLSAWVENLLIGESKYLFISSRIIDGSPFSKLKSIIRNRVDYKIVCLYLKENVFSPHIYIEKTNKKIIHQWENSLINNI